MKPWFDWRGLRRPQAPARSLPEPAGQPTSLRLLPKKRPLWARFGRKPSPFALRPGAVESWMKARPAPQHTAPDGAARRPNRDDRGDVGGGR